MHELVVLTEQNADLNQQSTSTDTPEPASTRRKRAHADPADASRHTPATVSSDPSCVIFTPFAREAQRYASVDMDISHKNRAYSSVVDDGTGSASTSSWYPSRESSALLGSPDFLARGLLSTSQFQLDRVYSQVQDSEADVDTRMTEAAHLWAGAPATLE